MQILNSFSVNWSNVSEFSQPLAFQSSWSLPSQGWGSAGRSKRWQGAFYEAFSHLFHTSAALLSIQPSGEGASSVYFDNVVYHSKTLCHSLSLPLCLSCFVYICLHTVSFCLSLCLFPPLILFFSFSSPSLSLPPSLSFFFSFFLSFFTTLFFTPKWNAERKLATSGHLALFTEQRS